MDDSAERVEEKTGFLKNAEIFARLSAEESSELGILPIPSTSSNQELWRSAVQREIARK
jgi:hypothetical protein